MSIVAAFAVPHPPLIIPAVGHGREEGIRATVEAYQEVARRIERLAPQTIVLSSPHATCYRDYVHVSPGTGARGDFLQFGAPDAAYEADYDSAFVSALDAAAQADALRGRHVLLVDDVVTTGSTMAACGRQLCQVEGLRLSLLSLAVVQPSRLA